MPLPVHCSGLPYGQVYRVTSSFSFRYRISSLRKFYNLLCLLSHVQNPHRIDRLIDFSIPITMIRPLLIASFFTRFTQSKTSSELCSGTAELSNDGNWYCSEVRAITYRNISQAGAYNQTTYVDPQTGLCGHERLAYPGTGPLTPLFGEVQTV